MTVLDLVKSILRLIGAISPNQTPKADQVRDTVIALNLLLGEWQAQGLLAFTELQEFAVTAGTARYTIGPDEDWNGHRPLRILNAALRHDQTDYWITMIGEDEYLEIARKSTVCIPTYLCYQPAESNGVVQLWGVPDRNYQISILSYREFTPFNEDGTEEIALPGGYVSALKYNGALEMYPEFERNDPPLFIVKRAAETIAAIKRTNLKRPKPVRFEPMFSGRKKIGNTFLSGGAV
jgi:hypothetical protein